MFALKQVHFKNRIEYPDIEIHSGCTTFICGPSGCGKSTLLKLLNGIITPEKGSVYYNGRNVESYDAIALRREVLLVGQSPFLLDATIRENFSEFYGYRQQPCPSDAQMQHYLRLCTLNLPLDNPCNTMSGGERHRVFIAISLSFLPKVLLLDEPTGALDDNSASQLMQSIKTFCMQSNITLIVVSHSQAISQFADETLSFGGNANERNDCP